MLAITDLTAENEGMRNYWRHVCIMTVIVAYLLFLYSPLLLLQKQTPAGTVNMMVGHYYEDYYEYLSFVKQGQQRQWYLVNLFTTDDPTRFWIPWWPYLVIGWFSSFFPVPVDPMIAYWCSAAVLTGVYLFLLFLTIRMLFRERPFPIQVGTFLLILMSPSLYSFGADGVTVSSFWGAMGSPFSRFGIGVPHHQITNIALLLSVIFLGKIIRRYQAIEVCVAMTVASLILFVLSWAQMVIFWGGYAVVTFAAFPRHNLRRYTVEQWILRWTPLLAAFLCVALCTYVLKQSVAASPTLSIAPVWDLKNIYYPSVMEYMTGNGVLFFLAPLGVIPFLKTRDTLRLFLFGVAVVALTFVMVPIRWGSFDLLHTLSIHNFRFSTTLMLLAAAVLTVEGLFSLLKRVQLVYTCMVVLFVFFTPALFRYFQMQTGPVIPWDILFMPDDTYTLLRSLDQPDDRGAVLTSPTQAYGLVIPALTGRPVFFGRSIFTLDLERKRKETEAFYAGGLDDQAAGQFLKQNGITRIMLGKGDPQASEMQQRYSFVMIDRENQTGTLLKIR